MWDSELGYAIAQKAIMLGAAVLGIQMAIHKPEPVVTEVNGQLTFQEQLSLAEKSVDHLSNIIAEIDPQVVARFYHVLIQKTREVRHVYKQEYGETIPFDEQQEPETLSELVAQQYQMASEL